MAQVTEKISVKVGKEPVVIFPLKEWKKIESTMAELEETARFNAVFGESRGKKFFGLEAIRKKYGLK